MIDIIKKYLSRGFGVVPIKPKEKYPTIKNWQEDFITKVDDPRIPSFFKNGANIGIVTGEPSNIWVLDIDGEDGKNSLDQIVDGRTIPETLTAKTGGGGLHYFFEFDKRIPSNRANIYKNIDIRSTGGQVVAYPSIHPNNNQYKWISKTGDVAKAPEWLVELMLKKTDIEDSGKVNDSNGKIFESGARNDTLYRKACKYVNDQMDSEIYHNLVHELNRKQCVPPLTKEEVNKIIESAEKHLEKPKEKVNVDSILMNIDKRAEEAFMKSYNRTEKILGYRLSGRFGKLENVMEGIQNGMYLLGAMANIGKSAFLLNLCHDIINQNEEVHVLEFSIDDSFNDVFYRLLAKVSQKKINQCANIGGSLNQEDQSAMCVYYDDLSIIMKRFHIMDDKDGHSLEYMIRTIEAFKQRFPNLVVIIDNFHKIRGYDNLSAKDKYSRISEELKTTQSVNDIALICTVELRKLNHSNVPTVDDIKDTVQLHYDSQVVWMLHSPSERDDQSDKVYTSTEKTYPIVELHIQKNKLSSFKRSIDYVFQTDLSNIFEN